jgi:hypothetical protein
MAPIAKDCIDGIYTFTWNLRQGQWEMSVDLNAGLGSIGGMAGSVRFVVTYGQNSASASAPAMLAQMFAQSGGDATSELAHIMKTGQYKGGAASLAIAAYAASTASWYGLTDKLQGGATVTINMYEGRHGFGSVQASVQAQIGAAVYRGIDPYAPKPKPVRRDTVAQIHLSGVPMVEVEIPAKDEFTRLTDSVIQDIQNGLITVPWHIGEYQIAAGFVSKIIRAGISDDDRDDLVGGIGALIHWAYSGLRHDVAGSGQVVEIYLIPDGPLVNASVKIRQHS